MDQLVWVLQQQSKQSPQVQQLLDSLPLNEFGIDVYICSFGGVGSTHLSNFLTGAGLRCNLLTDQDAARHAARPPPRLGVPPPRVVYLYGHPALAVASHYRRGQAHHQATKTNPQLRLTEGEFPATLEEYLARGEDLFGCEAHFHNWATAAAPYDILLVRYEDMYTPVSAQALMQHVWHGKHMPAEQLTALVQKWVASYKPRKSHASQGGGSSMYEPLWQQMQALPPVLVRPAVPPSSQVDAEV